MIEEILIKDSPAFTMIRLECHSGLNVITGASGAGKSVFFHSLLALFGLKDCNASLIQGRLRGGLDLQEYLDEGEVEIQIIKKDKARYFINHQSSSKKRIGEIFSPYVKFLTHKVSDELQSHSLLSLLDRIEESPSHQANLTAYKEKFLELQAMRKKLKTLEENEQNLSALREIALFEIDKIESIQPKIGEYEELLEVKKMLSKKDKLQSLAIQASQAIDGMSKVGAFLECLELEIPGYYEMIRELESLIQSEMTKLCDLEGYEPERILDRLSSLSSLINRYGSIQIALQTLQDQKEKLQGYDRAGEDIQATQDAIGHLEEELRDLADEISHHRLGVLHFLENQIQQYADLLLLHDVRLHLREVALGESGRDLLDISLGDSALETLSSGEYNRLRLAVLAVETKEEAGVLLLDEIDANLSGQESQGIAQVLKSLSRCYQVFAISHQPHLPSLADSHFLIRKGAEGSEMKPLEFEERVSEIARMISGSHLTQEALEFARKKLSP